MRRVSLRPFTTRIVNIAVEELKDPKKNWLAGLTWRIGAGEIEGAEKIVIFELGPNKSGTLPRPAYARFPDKEF